MQELLYTVLELETWNRRATCDFCPGLNKAVCQIRTRSKLTDKIVSNSCSCEEWFENDKLPKCSNCGRLETKDNFFKGKHVCDCIRYNKDIEEKELPSLPHEQRQTAFYERQINGLQEELATAEEALEIEREEVAKFQEKSEEWSKRQKQELLDKIKSLEEKIKQLEEENNLLKGQQNGQVAQIEVKENKRWSWLKVKK